MVGDLMLSVFQATDGYFYLACKLYESEDDLLTTQYYGPYVDQKTAELDVANCPYDAQYLGKEKGVLDPPEDIESDSIEDILPRKRDGYLSSRQRYSQTRTWK